MAAALALWAGAGAAVARPLAPSHSDFGGVGLLETRNARFAEDGLFTLGFSSASPYRRYYLNLQVLPWFEGTFRYTVSADPRFDPGGGNGDTILDRGADVKFELSGESKYFPAVALGFQDLLGTGLFQSEYLVFGKRYYGWDFSLGLAWGRQGSRGTFRNPFTLLSDHFKTRGAPGRNEGGQVSVEDFFTGEEVGLFAGIEYVTPVEGLRLKLELDGNDYENEPKGVALPVDAPVNFAVVYDPWPWVSTSLGIERGNTVMARLELNAPLDRLEGVPKLADRPPPAVASSPSSVPVPSMPDGAEQDLPELGPDTADRLFDRFEAAGVEIEEVRIERDRVTVDISPPPLKPAAYWQGLAAEAALALPAGAGPIVIVSREPAGELVWAKVTPAEVYRARAIGADLAAAAPAAPAVPAEPSGAPTALADALFDGLEAEGFEVTAVELEGDEIRIFVSQDRYRQVPRALGRAARVVANLVPASLRLITVVTMSDGVETNRVSFLREAFVAGALKKKSPEEVWASTAFGAPEPIGPEAIANPELYPAFSWALEPKFRQHIGREDAFLRYQLLAQLSGELEVSRGFFAGAGLGANVTNNIEDLEGTSDSKLPHVRSDIAEYLKEGEESIQFLDLHYLFQPVPEWYARLSGGYFEEMFMGVSGELLYRPYGSRWAFGAEIDQVWQREFDQRFGLLEGERAYNVFTAHASVYYRMPFYDLVAAVHAGRYLARDAGATLELSREFASGVKVGAWATLTDVPPAQFGEGSFDKGFFISIPLDLFFVKSRRDSASFAFRPLSRDGGQRLFVRKRLYGVTNDADLGGLADDWDRLYD